MRFLLLILGLLMLAAGPALAVEGVEKIRGAWTVIKVTDKGKVKPRKGTVHITFKKSYIYLMERVKKKGKKTIIEAGSWAIYKGKLTTVNQKHKTSTFSVTWDEKKLVLGYKSTTMVLQRLKPAK